MKTLLLVAMLATLPAFAQGQTKEEKLFRIVDGLQGQGDCGHSSCFASISKLECRWAVNPQSTQVDECSFVDNLGKEKTIRRKAASALMRAIARIKDVETDTAGPLGGYASPQDVSCREARIVDEKADTFEYDCHVEDSQE